MTIGELIESLKAMPADGKVVAISTCECCTDTYEINADEVCMSEAADGTKNLLFGSCSGWE